MSSAAEEIKTTSRQLRGAIAPTLADPDAAKLSDADEVLVKFHGIYQGFNRDTSTARKQQGLDKEWEFMVRVKLPGGRMTPAQYLALDALADPRANGTLRITSRQGVQFHNVMKGDLAALIAGVNDGLMTTFGGCGDVVRNVTCSVSPVKTPVNDAMWALARAIHAATLPRSTAYHEIWVDGVKQDPPQKNPLQGGETLAEVDEPLYGAAYLTRKFKIGIAAPDDNTIDVLTNDIGLLAAVEGGAVVGYTLCLGGGFGCKHNKPETYPRIATPVAFVPADRALEACLAVVRLARDHCDRENRQHARLKYLVEEKGEAWVKATLEGPDYFGAPLAPPPPLPHIEVADHLGWHEQGGGLWYLGLPVTSGRIKGAIRKAIREVVERFSPPLIAMPTEDLIFCDIKPSDKADIEAIFRAHGVPLAEDHTPVELHAMSCVALPTCGKALTEGERAREPIINSVRAVLERHGLGQEKLTVRITGCPNGCSRPYTGDIGIVGRAPGMYAVYVGGDFAGTRLSHRVADKVKVERLGDFLEPFVAAFAADRQDGEGFGDFCHRIGPLKRDALAGASGAAF